MLLFTLCACPPLITEALKVPKDINVYAESEFIFSKIGNLLIVNRILHGNILKDASSVSYINSYSEGT